MEPTEYYESVDLHIRWSEGQDIVLRASPQDSVHTIKEKIRQSSSRAENKYIRLIHNGKMLEDAKTLKEYGIGKIIRADSKAKLEPPSPVYLHCSLSNFTPTNPQNNQPQMTPPTGFDRLRESGFTEEDIRNIRIQFHRLHGTPFEEGPSEEARNLEEQWMDNTGETLPDGSDICAQQLHELQASVLSYGKLNLHNNKKPTTYWALQLSKLVVPKRYFSHFYIAGLTAAIISIIELVSLSYYKKPLFLMCLLDHYDNRAGSRHISKQQCITGLMLITFHLSRRVYESFYVEKPSRTATMHFSHYLVGIGFYNAMVLGTWLEGVTNFESWQPPEPSLDIATILAITLFLYASYHQHKCHVILSSLRSKNEEGYSIPRGDWFEILVTPHYFADILVYLSLNILYRFQNCIMLCGLIWTTVNLSIVSKETQVWYHTHFSAEKYNRVFPHGRKRIIPGLY
ncbi:hypothetical protein [Parasitella parasitica]|uniref:Ubiquitin-like domain-containing protein n=1 Tax=Parasitella parasitica TaxID=35722 RepID=A0A0B7NJ25_9FUNG|nr:hypothetical protein [Parasitella parasitica]